MQSINPVSFQTAHHNMMEKQIREQFMLSESVLNAIAATPRHLFVPKEYESVAYAETKIPLAQGEVMMTPNEEARMLAALDIKPSDKILEVGTGSGYVTALLAQLGHTIVSVDIHQMFIDEAQNKLSELQLRNVSFKCENGFNGLDAAKPFDVICITGGVYFLSEKLVEQIRDNGRIFAVTGDTHNMRAMLFTKKAGELSTSPLYETQVNYLKNIPKPKSFNF